MKFKVNEMIYVSAVNEDHGGNDDIFSCETHGTAQVYLTEDI